MTSKKYWERLSLKFIEEHRKISKIHPVSIEGILFDIFPGVFSPFISSDTAWFARKVVPFLNGKAFLEIGTGAGIISCLASINGAKKVCASDINLAAVENTKHNQKKLKLNFPVFYGDLFDPIEENNKFDIIFWNHPFNYFENTLDEKDKIIFSVFDTKYQSLKLFFERGKNYLKKDGILLLGTGNIARVNLIKQFAKENKYTMHLEKKTEVAAYKNKRIKMDLRLYSFKPITKGCK